MSKPRVTNEHAADVSLKNKYYTEVRPRLQTILNLKNVMEVPRIEKIVLNVGVKRSVGDTKRFQFIEQTIGSISGQVPLRTKARTSIASFKLREGMPVGVTVTLRRNNMYQFLDKLINLSLPKVRDFQGVKTRLDGRGNYNIGVVELGIFPETDDITLEASFGLNITIHTSAKSDEHGFALLKELGMPFKKSKG